MPLRHSCPRGGCLHGALLTLMAFTAAETAAAADSPASAAAPDAELRDYLSANGLLNRGLYELAAAEYGKFLSAHSEHEKAPVARYGLAVCYFRLKRHDEALREAQPLRGRSGFEFAAEVETLAGQCLLSAGKHSEALEAFDRVVKKHERHELADDAAAGAVEAAFQAGRYEDARTRSNAFISRWSESPLAERVTFLGCMASVNLHDYPAATAALADHLKRHPKGPFADQASLLLAQCQHRSGAVEQAAMQYAAVARNKTSHYIDEALYGLGLLLQQQGRPAEAGEALDRLLKEFPESRLTTAARLARGRSWFEAGKLEEASQSFEKALKAGGDQEAEAAYWLAKCKLRAGDYEDAARAFKQAIDRFPNHELQPEMHYDRAVALLRAEKTDRALTALEAFRETYPRHAMVPEALRLMAITHHQRGAYDRSAEACAAFLEQFRDHPSAGGIVFLAAENEFLSGHYEPAVAGYRRYLKDFAAQADAMNARFRLGLALHRLNRPREAAPLLDEVARTRDRSFLAALLILGEIAFDAQKWGDAEARLRDYVAAFKSNSSDETSDPGAARVDDALIKLGLAILRQGRHTDAIEVFDELLSRFKDSPHRLHAVFERAQALVALKRDADAAAAFEAVLADGPDSRFVPHALNHLGRLAMQAKDYDRAARYFDKLGSRADADASVESIVTESTLQRAQALMASENYADAQTAFAEFAQRNPDHPQALRARAQAAIALARLDRHADAVKAIDRVLDASDGQLDEALRIGLKYERAWCLRQGGRADDAASQLKALVKEAKSSPYGPHVLLELADLEMSAKRFDSAADLLRQLTADRSNGQDAAGKTVPREILHQALYRLGVCEFEAARYEAAADAMARYLDEAGTSAQTASALYFCGEALFKLGRHKQALARFETLVEAHRTDSAYGPALLRIGECHAALQAWPASEAAFALFLERFPSSEQWYQAQFGEAWALENQGRQEQAIAGYRRVAEKHQGPTAARAQFQIGECLFARKKYDEAVRELLKVDILYAYPEWSAAALFEAGRCFEALGKLVEARTQYKTVVDKYKQTEWSGPAAERLKAVARDAVPARAG